MENYILKSPVRMVIWSRKECLKKQFDIIKKVKPRVLFIQSDGGRNVDEHQKILDNRCYIEKNITWNCEVHKIYSDSNKGFYAMLKSVEDYIWDRTDRCIFLEDDTLATESFFYFCDEMLETYKNDYRIGTICGMNHLGIYEECDSDYFFSRQGSIWGTATWRRTYEQRKYDYFSSSYTMRLLKDASKDNKIAWKRMNDYPKYGYSEKHPAGDEFWIEFDVYGQHQLQIVPKYNLTSNVGFGGEGLNTSEYKTMPDSVKKIFNMNMYELSFPLTHPQYVIPDELYEKKRNRIMGYNYPIISFYRKIIHILKEVIYGEGPSYIFRKIRTRKNTQK